MYSITKVERAGFELYQLTDETTGTMAAVMPACGAMLHTFSIKQNGETLNVIDGYANRSEFENELEAKGFKGSKLSPFVCRMNKGEYHFGEKDYKIAKFYLPPHAIHGLIYDVEFELVNTRADEKSAAIEMRYAYRASDPGFPFKYDCIVKYELSADNALRVVTTIVNNDEGLIPVADGWHPYFTFGGSINDCQLEFQSKEMVVFDDTLLPTGELSPYQEFGSLKKINDQFFDNCFTVNFAECQPMLVLRDPSKKVQVEIHPETSYPYLQIYTPPHRNSIAIENLSAAPDAFNNGMGLKTLAPGETASFTTVYKIVQLSQA